jgi:hypothetical protein
VPSRRRALVAASSVAALFAIGAACTFPSVDFAGTDGGTDSGNDTTSGGGDAAIDAPLIEASTHDADTTVDAEGCTSCDCDHDGFFARTADGGCEGGPDSGYDCDDTDSFINQGRGFVDDFNWTSKVHAIPYDWNCSGAVEKAYPTGLKCAYAGILTNCVGGYGFTGDPACGTDGDYFECQDLGAFTGGCAAVKIDTRHQLCQ